MIMSKGKFEKLDSKLTILLSLGGKPSTGKARQEMDAVLIELFKKNFKKNVCHSK